MSDIADTTSSAVFEDSEQRLEQETRERQLEEALAHERAYVDRLYDRLEVVREETREKLAQVRRDAPGGSHQNRSERDAYATHYEDRLAQLDAVDHRLVFGRLDLDDASTRYIGRIGLADADYERLMVDWRAPEAGTFYQATAFDRQGVQRRRHLILERRTLRNIEDDVLDPDFLDGEEVLHGEGALLAALNRKRTGRMGDIVATIQAEQDRIIRSELPGVHVVQGGPGTGKTAVALHRAAYLLYTNRERLQKSGVLVVGPSTSFMWYIERVLPSLGETGVVMSSLATLYPGIHAVAERDVDVARLKGSLAMVEVVKRAVADRQKVPERTQRLRVDSSTVELTPQQVRHARDRARATGKPHNQARETFVKILVGQLADQLERQLNESSGNDTDRPYLVEDVRQSRDVRVALNLAWMPLRAETLVGDLFGKRHYLTSAAPWLEDAQVEAMLREPGAPFTEADVPLLDEAAELLGDFEAAVGHAAARAAAEHSANLENATKALENVDAQLEEFGVNGVVTAEMLAGMNRTGAARMTAAEAATSDRTWAYGHVVVDEAQELSPMQWRLLMRRCPMKSFTIVGDIAQASAAAASASWDEALEPFLGGRFQLDELTVNYRTPAQISEAAVSMARAAGLEVSAPRAVREGEWAPRVVRTDDVAAAVARSVAEDLSIVAGGLIGVIAAEPEYAAVARAVTEAHREVVGSSETALERQVLVLTPWEAKGLEFDAVVIAEPASVIRAARGVVGDLYVSMTRPTQRLTMVCAEEVPAGLEEWAEDGRA
ncbi:AAA family ATPase [Rothia sp. AR01]|uniref:AAA family ATPase n=1 Tax=Rothia santali TaxID=2949643 RepID=A0A9X2HCN6_9MICC|nr:AAA family ATPase [Rothia santali]MCP3425277.1 AAA family ATPase [Rothia santali]